MQDHNIESVDIEKSKSPVRNRAIHKRKASAAATYGGGSKLTSHRSSAIVDNKDTKTKLYTGFL